MRQVKCEMCGSTDFVKEDGLFVCQSCGIKYSLEEAKKLMVEGTVKVDKADEVQNLLKRAFMYLEDGNWKSADDYCERVLDIDHECAQAYLYKLMAELRVKKQEDLKDCAEPFNNHNNYQKVLRFADEKLRNELKELAKESLKAQEEKDLVVKHWKNAGLCQYCGGELKGFFTEKCIKCGKRRDYCLPNGRAD